MGGQNIELPWLRRQGNNIDPPTGLDFAATTSSSIDAA
jgi:hypothetical protein